MPLVSPSEDGEIIAQIGARWGYKLLRGSSSHSIIKAWNEMKKELEKGGEVIIVPDGPRGPGKKMKPGAVKLAKETGAYLVPFTFSSSKRKTLKTWDRFVIPRPLTRYVAVYGDPMVVGSNLNNEDLKEKLRELEESMNRLDREADSFFD